MNLQVIQLLLYPNRLNSHRGITRAFIPFFSGAFLPASLCLVRRFLQALFLLVMLLYSGTIYAETALGPLAWVTVLCKYNDVENEPATVSEIEALFGDEPGQLNHYWKESSYGKSSLDGSAVYGWYNMPSDRADYFRGNQPDTVKIVSDCVQAANDEINFSDYYGINVFLNDVWQSGSGGHGGSIVLDIDGRSVHRFTALGSNSWVNHAAIVHEMGHGIGLRHPNNFDLDNDPYDNPWSVMSAAYIDAAYDTRYGYLAKHFSAYEKEILGWFDTDEIFTLNLSDLNLGSSQAIQLDPLGTSNGSNYRMLKLVGGSSEENFFYTVEARERGGLYEGGLKSTAVIIHEVDLINRRSAWVVDAETPPADISNNEGSMWTQGEVYNGDGFDLTFNNRDSGGYEIVVTANNGSVNGNSVPFIRPINHDQNLVVGYPFQLYFHPVDPDGFAPEFFASGMPADAVLKKVASDTWLFEWTPEQSDLGLTIITFRVQDAIDASVGDDVVVNLSVSETVPLDHGPTGEGTRGRPEPLLGSQPWVAVLCKFSDVAAEPATRAFVQEMYGDAPGQLNHWWKTVSYGKTDISGSVVVGWYDLPRPRSSYVVGDSRIEDVKVDLLTEDCINAADSDVDFSQFYGVSTFFNGAFNSKAAGFGIATTVNADNADLMAATAIASPFWTYHTAVNHEMGLAVGLPRSNNSDRDASTFDNPWTNMSDGRGYAVRDLRYEYLAKHLNAFEKYSLGWLEESEVLVLDVGDLMSNALNMTLAPMSHPQTSHYRAVILTDLQRGPDVFYTLEARESGGIGSYDASLPGTAVIVHEVDLRRQQPAWALADLSHSSQVADYAYTENDMWVVGETIQLPGVSVVVKSRQIDHGFKLQIQTGLERESVPTSISQEDPQSPGATVTPQTQPSFGGSGSAGGVGDSGGSGSVSLFLLLVLWRVRRYMSGSKART